MSSFTKKNIIFPFGIICIAVICCIIVYAKAYLLPMLLLPASYLLIILLFGDVYMFVGKSVVVSIVFGGSILRMLLLPLLSVLVENSNILSMQYTNIQNNMLQATLLVAYEILCVHGMIYYLYKKKNRNYENITVGIKMTHQSLISKATIMLIFVMLIFAVIVINSNTSLKYYFYNILESNSSFVLRYNATVASKNQLGIFYWIITYVLDLLNYLLPGAVGVIICKKMKSHAKIIPLTILLILIFFIVSEQAYISYTTAISIIILYLWDEWEYLKTKKITILCAFAILIIIFGIMLSAKNEQSNSSLVGLLNAYFPNVVSTSYVIEIKNQFQYLFYDMLNSIPFAQAFFSDLPSGANKFLEVVELYNPNTRGQIIPMIGQGYIYFGYLLSPILAAISVRIAYYFERKYASTKTGFQFYLYLVLTVASIISIFMYNFSTLIYAVMYIFPMLVLVNFTERLRIKI